MFRCNICLSSLFILGCERRSSCGITIRQPEWSAYTSGSMLWETGGVSLADKGKGKACDCHTLPVLDKHMTQTDGGCASYVCLPSPEINEAVTNRVTRDAGTMHTSSVVSPGSQCHNSANFPGKYTFALPALNVTF